LCRSEKPVDGKPADDGYPCELCGAWIDYCDLGKLLGHEVFAAASCEQSY